MSKGKLVSFEGGEGGGKSTQIARCQARLESLGFRVLSTREPGGIKISELIRAILLDPKIETLDPITELMLFNAARREVVQKLIRPALEECDVVIMDRFFDSTTAYQGYGRGIDLDLVRQIVGAAVGDLVPDLTIVLDLDPRVGIPRATSVEVTRFEEEDIEFHDRVRAGFQIIAMSEPERMKLVDATPDPDTVFRKIIDAFAPLVSDLQEGR